MSIRPKKPVVTRVSQAKAYDTIVRPVITEKATMSSENGRVSFVFRKDGTKPEIKAAVEMLFDVKVVTVNTLITKGKIKIFRGRKGRRSDVKKAIVTLAEGQSIEIMGA